MKCKIILISIMHLMLLNAVTSQELFSYTEPASNMAANSIGLRLTSNLMNENSGTAFNQLYKPEIMWGVSKKIMLHAEGFVSDMNKAIELNGASLYLKYRFFSKDDIHSHFRMALYGKYSISNNEILQPSIDLNGLHSGSEIGLIATQLIGKIALSSSVSWIHAQQNLKGNQFQLVDDNGRGAVNYTLSIGKLMIPKEYVSYNQTNLNLMLETIGQTNLTSGLSNLDIAPVLQFIIQSKMRIDLGYRIPVSKQLYRSFTESAMIRFEYNFFNVVK